MRFSCISANKSSIASRALGLAVCQYWGADGGGGFFASPRGMGRLLLGSFLLLVMTLSANELGVTSDLPKLNVVGKRVLMTDVLLGDVIH